MARPTGEPSSVSSQVRRFNRFYTGLIGTLSKDYLDTPYTLQEARVLYEIGNRPACTAKEVRSAAGFDQGYLSRLIARLVERGLVRAKPSVKDAREKHLTLTPSGTQAFRTLNRRADAQADALVRHLHASEREELMASLRTVERLLGDPPPAGRFTIRTRRVGDLGWTFHRQAVVYQEEFGYLDNFEAYVCESLPPFLQNQDPKRDELWVAEKNRRKLGFVAIHHAPERPGWAKLRWFLVEKEARGMGVGSALLDRALAFAKRARYRGVFLTTVSDLVAARSLYQRRGFRLVHEEPCPWAPGEKEQRWELPLAKPR